MAKEPKITDYLFETNAFQHLEKPVILTSGEIGIYYCNTEKLCQDGGEFEKYGDYAITVEENGEIKKGMREHAIMLYNKNDIFKQVVDVLAEKVDSKFKEMQPLIKDESLDKAVSGGQRRDWLFSFPVAHVLGIGHIAIYKDMRMQFTDPAINGEELICTEGMPDEIPLGDQYVIHVADLLTEGSSARNIWIPSLRRTGAKIDYMLNVVTRKQGGEESLMAIQPHVVAESLASINSEFIMDGKGTNEQKKQAIEYIKNPGAWGERYIAEQGIDAFVKFFDPNAGKTDRASKFLDRYGNVLEKTGRLDDLDEKVHKSYNIRIMKN